MDQYCLYILYGAQHLVQPHVQRLYLPLLHLQLHAMFLFLLAKVTKRCSDKWIFLSIWVLYTRPAHACPLVCSVWVLKQLSGGWKHAKVENAARRLSPRLVVWSDLSEADQQLELVDSQRQLNAVQAMG